MSDQLLNDVTDLLEIGARIWLDHKEAGAVDEADTAILEEHRASRKNRLATVQVHMKRVAEVDVRIALLRATKGVPNRERCLRNLVNLRDELLRKNAGAVD